MLPKSVRSLAEIKELDRPIDRAREFGFLFEYVLRRITPDGRRYKFHELVTLHRAELANFEKLEIAREARNNIVHGDRITERTILQAEAEFQFAIESIFPVCPEDVQQDVRGAPHVRAPQTRPPDITEPVQPPPPPPPPQHPAQTQSSYLPPEPPDLSSKLPHTIWFVLAGAFVLVAVFAYLAQPHSEQAKTFPPKDVSGGSGPMSPTAGGSARREARAETPSAPQAPSREAVFRGLINPNLSVSSSQPNLALLDLFLVFRRPLGGVGRAILPAACFQQALVGNEEAD
jgi:hypothetical protein